MYVGVKEYWKAAWPGEAIPNIYFLNPMGFKSQEDLTYRELEDVVNDAEWKGNPRQNPGDARERGEILREFETVYRQLNKDKNQPVLVFDSCLHSGNTLEPVVRAMDDLGFSDVRVGSVNPADYGSKVKTDFYITTARPEKGCYPFDREHMIEKTFEHVYSQATKDPVKKMVANRLRAEIKAVMREFIEEEAALNNDDDPSAVSEK